MIITKETMITAIIEEAPEAMPMFQSIGMHCMGCIMARGENVEQACMAHGVNPDEFVTALNMYLAAE